jgi:hypothetical protein
MNSFWNQRVIFLPPKFCPLQSGFFYGENNPFYMALEKTWVFVAKVKIPLLNGLEEDMAIAHSDFEKMSNNEFCGVGASGKQYKREFVVDTFVY